MALIGNRTVLHKSPGRFLSGTVASIERGNFGQAGMLASRFQAMSKVFAGIPSGHLAPSSWALPRTAGGLSSANSAALSLAAGGLAVGGVTTVGSSAITVAVADADGQLIASAAGSAALAISCNGNLLASLSGTGTAAFTVSTNTPTLGAEANLVGAAGLVFGGSLLPYAIGSMQGSTVDGAVLTSDSVASAVWARVVEAGYTAEQILRIVAAHAAGAATGLEGPNPQFYGLDGATVRIDGAYTAGTRTIDALDGGA